MTAGLHEVSRVEIFTLQDNYIDLVIGDDSEMIQRAKPLRGREIRNSVLAEHGFSALVTVIDGGRPRSILFDFGFSEHGALTNAKALSVDLSGVEALVLSHGHMDHTGGFQSLVRAVGKPGIPLIVHPAVFRPRRFVRLSESLRADMPPFSREQAAEAGVNIIETRDPYPLLDGHLLFLGEIPRRTEFERGMPNARFEENGEEKWDPIEDDTGVAAHVKGKGLVVLSGCAHSGIVNTVKHAQALTGIEAVYAVMGGFHLTGPALAATIEPTTRALQSIAPKHVVPCHCTGRDATMHIEKEMPDQFVLNMSGTKLIFV
jgi:7,8-dihydropterin-6-yl-methyl-4-(beta-D-ribofuranosyl)aminobenzene 5'-phosphate synthase